MSGWSDPDRVSEYLGREIPHRRLAEELLLGALPERIDRVLDLGTGDGRLLRLILNHHAGAQGIGLDVSPPMLDRARERFDGASASTISSMTASAPSSPKPATSSDCPAPLEDQLTWLREAGFEAVDCRFKWMELALFLAFGDGPIG